MTNTRWLGVVSSLMMGAMLIAPMHSGAAGLPAPNTAPVTPPSITIQVGTNRLPGPPPTVATIFNTAVPLTINFGSCTTAEVNAGWTACYTITTGPYNGISVTNAPNKTAKLLIADRDGTGNSLDLCQVSGTKFSPPAGVAGTTVKVIYTCKYDTPGGVNAANSSYAYMVGLHGQFNPVTATEGSRYDYVKLLTSGDVSVSPVTWNIGLTGQPSILSAPFDRDSAVKTFTCGSPCTPTIKHVLVFDVTGSDNVVFNNSAVGGGGSFNLENPVSGGPPSGNAAEPLNALVQKLQNHMAKDSRAEDKDRGSGVVPSVPCSGDYGDDCPCDPDLSECLGYGGS